MLAPRQEQILRIIVREYVLSGSGIPSEALASRFGLNVSPATIRNDMARLSDEGYIHRPHISAGGVPSQRGYRFYVETLTEEEQPSYEEQVLLRHLFHQVEAEIDDWVRVAAAALARMVHNVALVTTAKASASRLRHLDLVRLQDFLALLVVVLEGARVRRQRLSLEQSTSQEDLHLVANHLNALWAGLNVWEIQHVEVPMSPLEVQVKQALVGRLQAEDRQLFEEPYLEGLRHVTAQPEFARQERLAQLVDFLEEREALKEMFQEAPHSGVRVLIGSENPQEAMQDCSVVLARYGLPGEREGALGVIGPMRMPYQRTIPLVRYLASLMTDMVQEVPI